MTRSQDFEPLERFLAACCSPAGLDTHEAGRDARAGQPERSLRLTSSEAGPYSRRRTGFRMACRDLPAASVARRYAAAASGGGPTTILATRERASLVDAVFASAVTGHAAEINDFSPSAYVQPGPPVLSTALLLGAARQRSGRDLLNAVVVGYEVSCRMPKALGIKNLRDGIGLASHSVGPTFGAGAAAASILRMPESRIPHLLS